jgi:hypothetical protein
MNYCRHGRVRGSCEALVTCWVAFTGAVGHSIRYRVPCVTAAGCMFVVDTIRRQRLFGLVIIADDMPVEIRRLSPVHHGFSSVGVAGTNR